VTVSTCLELFLPAIPASVRRVRAAAGETVDELTEHRRLGDDVRLCVSEAATNVVRHAYAGRARGDIHVVITRDDDTLEVIVRDTGRGLKRSRRTGPAGGFGLQIIEKLASRLAITTSSLTGTEIRMTFDVPVSRSQELG
jgi:anti-sigma regulatory factor (Ser/Thr protein kinase)